MEGELITPPAADVLTPVLTAAVAAAGLVVSTLTATKEYRAQQKKDIEQREEQQQRDALEREQVWRRDNHVVEEDERRRFDERFTQAVECLDAKEAAHKVAAVVLISTMVRERNDGFADQALRLLVCALQRHRDGTGGVSAEAAKMLLPVLEEALRQTRSRPDGSTPLRGDCTLTRLQAKGINLTGLDLQGCDLAFADMTQSSLSGVDLSRSRGYGLRLADSRLNQALLREVKWHCVDGQRAKFRWAKMTSAELRRGDFREADFFQARLQSAHFDGANLCGARFDRATLTDTFFVGAELDDIALRSLLRAKNWERAIFDATTAERLRAAEEAEGTER